MWPGPIYSDSGTFSSDNGPCRQVCRVVGDTAMCSCFPGYAIMADGVSCEGEYFGVTLQALQIWLACGESLG